MDNEERIRLLEERITALENLVRLTNNATGFALGATSKTIEMITGQLAPILRERRMIERMMKENLYERMFEYVKRTQKYPM